MPADTERTPINFQSHRSTPLDASFHPIVEVTDGQVRKEPSQNIDSDDIANSNGISNTKNMKHHSAREIPQPRHQTRELTLGARQPNGQFLSFKQAVAFSNSMP